MAKNEAFDEEMDRREYRRKRRIRNQMISYVVLALFVIGLAAGGIIGVKKIMKAVSDKRHTEELQNSFRNWLILHPKSRRKNTNGFILKLLRLPTCTTAAAVLSSMK